MTEEEPGVPAEDPIVGQTFAELFLSQYLPLVVGMASHTREPRVATPLRLKAADVALQLTFAIINRSERAAAGERT